MNDDLSFLAPNKFITPIVDEYMGRLSIHIRGEFPNSGEISEEIAQLYSLASEYDDVVLFINSPGGSVDTLAELLNIFDLYDTVITVAAGVVASAGFSLWASGDVRVVQKYSSMMAHRESYSVPLKTDQQMDLAKHANDVYGIMHSNLLGNILTDDELSMSKRSEVFLTPEQLIERGVAIDWNTFVKRDLTQYDKSEIIHIGEKNFIPFISENGGKRLVEATIAIGESYDYNDVIYKLKHEEELNELAQKPKHYEKLEMPDSIFNNSK